MQEHFVRMEHEISVIDPTQGMESQIQELAIAAGEISERERKLVYLCEDDSYQRLTLATQIGCFGFEVLSFGELDQLLNAVRSAPPDAIVMDMIFPDRPLGGADSHENHSVGPREPGSNDLCFIPGIARQSSVGCTRRFLRLFRETG